MGFLLDNKVILSWLDLLVAYSKTIQVSMIRFCAAMFLKSNVNIRIKTITTVDITNCIAVLSIEKGNATPPLVGRMKPRNLSNNTEKYWVLANNPRIANITRVGIVRLSVASLFATAQFRMVDNSVLDNSTSFHFEVRDPEGFISCRISSRICFVGRGLCKAIISFNITWNIQIAKIKTLIAVK